MKMLERLATPEIKFTFPFYIYKPITQIGKECHTRCTIFYQAGDCVMPKEGIFAKVATGDYIRSGDLITSSWRL